MTDLRRALFDRDSSRTVLDAFFGKEVASFREKPGKEGVGLLAP